VTEAKKVDGSEITRLQEEYLFPCVATYYEKPLVLVQGNGMHVTDAEGREYLDFFGGIVSVSVGHCDDAVTRAVVQQNQILQHVSTLYINAPQAKLAKKLAELTPGRLKKSFFTCSGTEANETAVLLARRATGRSDIIALRYSYSGRSEMTLNLTRPAIYAAPRTWRSSSRRPPTVKWPP
jgi:4-aminobutyrate aminotransferase-like enzyme